MDKSNFFFSHAPFDIVLCDWDLLWLHGERLSQLSRRNARFALSNCKLFIYFSTALDLACSLTRWRTVWEEAVRSQSQPCKSVTNFRWVVIWLWTVLFPSPTALCNKAVFKTRSVPQPHEGKPEKALVFVYAFAVVEIWLVSSSWAVSHDVFHLFVPCVNDKRFVAALMADLGVKPLKQTPERLVERFQVCSIAHPARQP